jgi:predicted nuclease of predicted toxin-antitoxin system
MIELESTTFFIDRCLGNKLIVETLRAAGVSVEIHDDHFGKNTQDVDWIPKIGKRGWIILTKDARIGKNQMERLAVADARVRMFVLVSQNLSGADMANIFVTAIPAMEKFIVQNLAPFIAKVDRDSKVKVWKDNLDLLSELDDLLKQT